MQDDESTLSLLSREKWEVQCRSRFAAIKAGRRAMSLSHNNTTLSTSLLMSLDSGEAVEAKFCSLPTMAILSAGRGSVALISSWIALGWSWKSKDCVGVEGTAKWAILGWCFVSPSNCNVWVGINVIVSLDGPSGSDKCCVCPWSSWEACEDPFNFAFLVEGSRWVWRDEFVMSCVGSVEPSRRSVGESSSSIEGEEVMLIWVLFPRFSGFEGVFEWWLSGEILFERGWFNDLLEFGVKGGFRRGGDWFNGFDDRVESWMVVGIVRAAMTRLALKAWLEKQRPVSLKWVKRELNRRSYSKREESRVRLSLERSHFLCSERMIAEQRDEQMGMGKRGSFHMEEDGP